MTLHFNFTHQQAHQMGNDMTQAFLVQGESKSESIRKGFQLAQTMSGVDLIDCTNNILDLLAIEQEKNTSF